MRAKSRNYSLDLIKVIAMIMVLLLHTGVFSQSYLHTSDMRTVVYAFSGIAVPLFFMVSGYLMIERRVDMVYVKNKTYRILKFIFITTTIVLIIYNTVDYVDNGTFTFRVFGINSYVSWIVQKGYMWHYWYFASMILLYFITAIVPHKYIFSSRSVTAFIIISFLIFILNILYQFESKYLSQSFRLYYWLMFYTLGGGIRKRKKIIGFIKWGHVLAVSIVYILFQFWGPNIGGTEYYFGSLLTMVYAVCVFGACLNTNITESKVICEMSKLFLPVYSLHVLFFYIFRYIEIRVDINPEYGFLLLCMIHCFLTILVCWLLMRNNFSKKIFKI